MADNFLGVGRFGLSEPSVVAGAALSPESKPEQEPVEVKPEPEHLTQPVLPPGFGEVDPPAPLGHRSDVGAHTEPTPQLKAERAKRKGK